MAAAVIFELCQSIKLGFDPFHIHISRIKHQIDLVLLSQYIYARFIL
ncbi:MAG: hypothetical protein K6F27_10550 [Ruminococcus sp.]|nr:hypothetical protein [Ruminococcus sp.]